MSEYITFIITTLVPEWTTNGHKFGPTMIKWLLKVKMSAVMGEYWPDNGKVRAELIKRQPQLKDDKILEIEESNIEIA